MSGNKNTEVSKELLVDGGFEQAKVDAGTWAHSAKVGGWKSDTEIEVWGSGFYDIKPSEGAKFAELDYDTRQSNIYQDVKTEKGVEYVFSFDSMKRPDSKAGSDTILVFWNGKLVGSVEPTSSTWSSNSFKLIGTGGNDRIEFREQGSDNDSYGGLIDNASLKSTGRVEAERAAASEKAAAGKAASEKAAEKAAAEKAAAEKAAAEKAAAEKAAAQKAAAEKAAAEKAAAEKAAAEKAAAEKVPADALAAAKDAATKVTDTAKDALGDKLSDVGSVVKEVTDVVGDIVDSLIGNGSVNKLVGTVRADKIFGEGNNDLLIGGDGNDQMHGGGGNDEMLGEAGDDLMFGSSTLGGNVDLTKMKVSQDTVAKVTFNGETADYKNAIGVYKIGPDGTIADVQIVYANASLKNSGGDLVAGVSSVDVPLKAGETLGFFIVPNGYSQKGMANLLSDTKGSFKFVDADGQAGNVNNGAPLKLVHVAASGKETVVQSAYGSNVFHSVDNGSLGLNGDKLNHAVATVNNADGTVKIGFEDLLDGGDQDYDDSVFTVSMGVTNTALLAKIATKVTASSDKDLMVGGEGHDTMFGMADDDNMEGRAGDDHMWGNSGSDVMNGGSGNDHMYGGKDNDVMHDGDGDDVVHGNSGDDVFVAGEGDDSYDGGSGFDTIDYSNAKNAVNVDLNGHTATGLGNDTIYGVEAVVGSAYNDVLFGDKNDNVFYGGEGDDWFRGRGGADTFSGGAGNDTYVWLKKDLGTGIDRITDFAAGDVLNLKDLVKGQKFGSIDDVVKVVDGSQGATVSVSIDGSYVDVVKLDGIHAGSASELLKAGMILV